MVVVSTKIGYSEGNILKKEINVSLKYSKQMSICIKHELADRVEKYWRSHYEYQNRNRALSYLIERALDIVEKEDAKNSDSK